MHKNNNGNSVGNNDVTVIDHCKVTSDISSSVLEQDTVFNLDNIKPYKQYVFKIGKSLDNIDIYVKRRNSIVNIVNSIDKEDELENFNDGLYIIEEYTIYESDLEKNKHIVTNNLLRNKVNGIASIVVIPCPDNDTDTISFKVITIVEKEKLLLNNGLYINSLDLIVQTNNIDNIIAHPDIEDSYDTFSRFNDLKYSCKIKFVINNDSNTDVYYMRVGDSLVKLKNRPKNSQSNKSTITIIDGSGVKTINLDNSKLEKYGIYNTLARAKSNNSNILDYSKIVDVKTKKQSTKCNKLIKEKEMEIKTEFKKNKMIKDEHIATLRYNLEVLNETNNELSAKLNKINHIDSMLEKRLQHKEISASNVIDKLSKKSNLTTELTKHNNVLDDLTNKPFDKEVVITDTLLNITRNNSDIDIKVNETIPDKKEVLDKYVGYMERVTKLTHNNHNGYKKRV